METTIKTSQSKTIAETKQLSNAAASSFWGDMERHRFGVIPIIAVIIGCMGGIAAAFGAEAETFKLALVAFSSILSLAFVLAVAPMRVIIYASVIALLLDIIVLVFNL